LRDSDVTCFKKLNASIECNPLALRFEANITFILTLYLHSRIFLPGIHTEFPFLSCIHAVSRRAQDNLKCRARIDKPFTLNKHVQERLNQWEQLVGKVEN